MRLGRFYTMSEYTTRTYGDAWAEIYDDAIFAKLPPSKSVEFLFTRVIDGRALDMGVGTGRHAIPLAARGVNVIGVDSSPAMLKKLRERDQANHVVTVLADMQNVELHEQFGLIYCIGQSFSHLQSQEHQIACLENVARHLAGGGVFVVEGLAPDVSRFHYSQDFVTNAVTADRVLLTGSIHDPTQQHIKNILIDVRPHGYKLYPTYIRYCWPSELIVMARLAGLALGQMWTNFAGTPYWGKPGAYIAEFRHADASY